MSDPLAVARRAAEFQQWADERGIGRDVDDAIQARSRLMEGDPVTDEKRTPLLCLDIDGTVRQGKDDALGRFVNGPDDVVVFPEAIEQMSRWQRRGGRILGVSNQGGIALGYMTMSIAMAAMLETNRQALNLFDKIVFCRHHPDASDPEMARCWCRKPSPGLIVEAALEMARDHNEIYPQYMGLMVGDRPEDEECARLAGLPFMWASDWRNGKEAVTDE